MIEQQLISSELILGPLKLNTYGILLGIGFAIIYLAVEKKYRERISIIDVLIVIIVTVIFARILYILHDFGAFLETPASAFQITEGGIAYHGALLGLITSVYLLTKRKGLPFWELLDIILLHLPLAHAIGRLGNYANQELYGLPTDLPIGIFIEPENRLKGFEHFTYFHPAFLYEMILNILLFLILRYISTRCNRGEISGIYLFGYGIIRLLMNQIRIDKVLIVGVESSDIYSVILMISGAIVLLTSGGIGVGLKNVSKG